MRGGLSSTPTGRGRTSCPTDVHLPVVEGAAHDGVLARLQHHVAADKLLHRPLAVSQQATQGQLVTAAKRGTKHHDAQVQQMTVGCVRTPAETSGGWVGPEQTEGGGSLKKTKRI